MTQPIVVLDAIAYCDGPPEHEARIITDGTRATATLHTREAPAVAVARDGVTLSGGCPGHWQGGPCPGTLTWGLDTEGAWTADHRSITLLSTYGEQVER